MEKKIDEDLSTIEFLSKIDEFVESQTRLTVQIITTINRLTGALKQIDERLKVLETKDQDD